MRVKGLHEAVRHIIGAQRGVGYERIKGEWDMSPELPAIVRRDALLHVNLSYSDSHEIFLLAPGDEAVS
jgi:hypothetical protein